MTNLPTMTSMAFKHGSHGVFVTKRSRTPAQSEERKQPAFKVPRLEKYHGTVALSMQGRFDDHLWQVESRGPSWRQNRFFFAASRENEVPADKVGKISFFSWNGGSLLRTGMSPFSETKHGSYLMEFWKSEQSAVLIMQEASTIEQADMEDHWTLVRHDD